MSDGWRGKVEENCGDFVVALRDGERSCPHWSGDYRLVSLSAITIKDNRVTVAWRSTSRRSRRSRSSLDAVLADYRRTRLEQEWQSIT
jgi:hypothetical protein